MPAVQYPVVFYTISHLGFIAVLWPAAVFLAVFLSRKYGFNHKIIWICMILAMASEIEKIFFFIADTGSGFRLPAEYLPFNLCSLQIFFISILALSHNPRKLTVLISFMYPALIGGGIMGSMVPSFVFDFHGLEHLATYRFFIYHAMLIFLGLYLYMSKAIEFNIKSFGYAVLVITMIFIFAVWINGFFGWNEETNFCYFVRPPSEGLPVINMNRGWNIYVFTFAAISFLIFFFCYLKIIIADITALIKKNCRHKPQKINEKNSAIHRQKRF